MKLLHKHFIWIVCVMALCGYMSVRIPAIFPVLLGIGVLLSIPAAWIACVRWVEYKRAVRYIKRWTTPDFLQGTAAENMFIGTTRAIAPVMFLKRIIQLSDSKGRRRALTYAFYKTVHRRTWQQYQVKMNQVPIRYSSSIWKKYFWPCDI